jgi:predicted pyridoxine 5'-phosphate oxidase superfamily flavin-nucleotide-binding protein
MTGELPPAVDSPWHRGELAIQAQAGVVRQMDGVGRRVIRDHMPDQHREFFAQLPFLVAGSVDDAGDPWATLLAGRPGFAQSPDPRTLAISMLPAPDDPVSAGLVDGAAVGLLGIELHTRRRNRMNGTVRRRDGGFDVAVGQSFGNCPKYIQLRDYAFVREPGEQAPVPPETMAGLDDAARLQIRQADTFFVASYSDDPGTRQVDVSHRGGKTGFVRVEGDTLTIPDFAGNFFFATLGNILLNGKAGLVFADFETGDLLQMSGEAELVATGPEAAAFEGAERFWRFRPRRMVRRRDALPLRWTFQEGGWSPHALRTGDWPMESGAPRPHHDP